jgi:nucleoside-diphosphate-sugar epimerase
MSWRGARVLVSGATGFIGANLTRRLVAEGAQVHALARAGAESPRLHQLIPAVTVHAVDLTDRTGLTRVARTAAPQFIFHLGALGASQHNLDRAQLFLTNVIGTINMVEATEGLPYARFVHIGSSTEYGPKPEMMRESDCLAPVTAFGASKAAATLACQQFARARQRPLVILRPFSVYGPWEAPTRLIPTAIRAALDGEAMDLTAPGYRRDLIFVDDVVDACLLAATADLPHGEIVNVGTGRQWSNEDVVRTIESVCGRPIRVRVGQYPARLSDTDHWVADITRADALLGWKPAWTLTAGLERTVSWWIRQRGRSDAA